MSASFGNASYSPAARPRLTPGIPAGGIAAIVVTLAAIAGSAIFGDDGRGDPRSAFDVRFDGAGLDVRSLPPLPPPPPAAPVAPVAPVAPAAPLAPGAMIDHAQIARTVEEALRGIDHAEIARTVEEALRGVDGAEIARTVTETLREQAQAARADAGGGALAANFDARALRLVNVHGDIQIEVGGRDTLRLEVAENANMLRTSVADGLLTIIGAGEGGHPVDMRLRVPEGADLTIAGQVGDLVIGGRAAGALTLDILRGDVLAKTVASATIRVHQASDISIDRVEGALRYAGSGAGDLIVDRAGDASITIAGSGSVALDRVGGLTLAIPGHADVNVGRVDGPVKTAFMGAGSVHIARGEAKPLLVTVTGAGEFRFDGMAHEPVVLADGNGQVHVARHTGKASVQNRGQGTAWVGD